MARKQDFLVEIGCEELPPKSLALLSAAFADGISKGLAAVQLEHAGVERFATPRRLAARVRRLAGEQPPQELVRTGPSVANAFDADGQPTKAALGFAASCGAALDTLLQEDGPKGKVLVYRVTRSGAAAPALLPKIVNDALNALPIAKRMRWGSGEAQFVRPVHWVVMLLGSEVIECEILSVRAGKHTRGHRFHAPKEIAISGASHYERLLRTKGFVIADATERKNVIRSAVIAAAQSTGGSAVIEEALLEEVTALVEWPVALAGRFDERFLRLPAEVPIATLQDHQRYFPVRDAGGALLASFIAVANIQSNDPGQVSAGNERVVRPRLTDAAFFWDTDRKQSLSARRELLKNVTFQQKLGSLYDKSERLCKLAEQASAAFKCDVSTAQRAAELAKCDLLTAMVGEFPELQGLMGRYYAQHDGESPQVCAALEEQYRPRFAGDDLPQTPAGSVLALIDKIDTLAGIFAIGQKPTGTRDPFGLRRAAVGVLRILLEKKVELDLRRLVGSAVMLQPVATESTLADEVYDYILERLRAYYGEGEGGMAIAIEVFDAVLVNRPTSPVDFDARIRALNAFLQLPDAQSLTSANKRIANLLRKSESPSLGAVNSQLLTDEAEKQLFDQIVAIERAVVPLLAQRSYESALSKLAMLRAAVDRFFDSVMVMTDDVAVRENRIALLVRLRKLFLQIADLSRLPG